MYKETESLLENTRFEVRINDEGCAMSYRIYPDDGYMLHDSSLDEVVFDEATGEETGKVIPRYTKGFVTAGYNYDFKVNPREIYAITHEEVSAGREGNV